MKTNELIAEFMAIEKKVFNTGILNYGYGGSWYEEHELSYKVSWDWLMPVVKKCYDTNNVTCGECGNINHADENDDEILCKICLHSSEPADFPDIYISYVDENLVGDITHGLLDCDIEKTFIAVIEFIKYTRLW